MKMSADKDALFENKGFIHFINNELSQNREFLDKITAEAESLQQGSADIDIDLQDRNKILRRITDFLIKLYGKFDDEDWKRITEDRCGELLELLSKSVNRDKFYETKETRRTEINRYLILRSIKFENWHLFPSLSIDLNANSGVESHDHDRVRKSSGNIVTFIGRNSEGKSAIFEGIKMGLLGPDKYFLSNMPQSEKNKKILELLNKKAIENAISAGEKHVDLRLQITFRLKKENSEDWDDYCITRLWQISLDFKNPDGHKVYNFESKYERLDVFGVGNHQELVESSFNLIFRKYIPEPLQDLFITNKTILTRSLIEEGANFIESTALKSSDFNILEILEKTVSKLQQFVEQQEYDWILHNIKENKKKFSELEREKERLEKSIDDAVKHKVKKIRQKKKLKGTYDNKHEQTKDFNQAQLDTYLTLKQEANRINEESRKLSRNVNKIIDRVYVDHMFDQILRYPAVRKNLKIAESDLPTVPEDTEFSHFKDYYDILKQIIDSGECICGTKISDDIKESFGEQIIKENIQAYHTIHKESMKQLESIKPVEQELLDEISKKSQQAKKLEKDYKKKLRQMENSKPKGLAKKPRKILKEMESIEKEIKKIDGQITELENHQDESKVRLKELKSEIDEIKKKINDPALEEKKKRFTKLKFYLRLTWDFLEAAKKKYKLKLQQDVEHLITSYFKEIDWEGKFWDGFKIDEDWEIKFVDKNDHSITLPSDGQKKIIMISFICSLIELHRYKIPWLMDNVLSEISDLNIEGFSKQIISNEEFPQQMFFFSITEWGDIRRYLQPAVMQAFGFEKLSAIESSVRPLENLEEITVER